MIDRKLTPGETLFCRAHFDSSSVEEVREVTFAGYGWERGSTFDVELAEYYVWYEGSIIYATTEELFFSKEEGEQSVNQDRLRSIEQGISGLKGDRVVTVGTLRSIDNQLVELNEQLVKLKQGFGM